MLASLTVFLSLLTASLAIINGTIAGPNEFPFVVSLQWDGQHKCGGTLINADTILTAAHCHSLVWVDPKQPSRVTALLGSRDQRSNGTYPFARVGIQRVIYHRKFPEKYKHHGIENASSIYDYIMFDFLLLKLNRSVSENAFIKYATLAENDNDTQLIPQLGDRCVPVGWGRYKSPDNVTHREENDFSRYLRKGLVTIVPIYKNCLDVRVKFHNFLCSTQEFRCGKSLGRTCFGDSGGPVICRTCDGRNYVAGLHLAGYKSCNSRYHSLFHYRIQVLREWIDENL